MFEEFDFEKLNFELCLIMNTTFSQLNEECTTNSDLQKLLQNCIK